MHFPEKISEDELQINLYKKLKHLTELKLLKGVYFHVPNQLGLKQK